MVYVPLRWESIGECMDGPGNDFQVAFQLELELLQVFERDDIETQQYCEVLQLQAELLQMFEQDNHRLAEWLDWLGHQIETTPESDDDTQMQVDEVLEALGARAADGDSDTDTAADSHLYSPAPTGLPQTRCGHQRPTVQMRWFASGV